MAPVTPSRPRLGPAGATGSSSESMRSLAFRSKEAGEFASGRAAGSVAIRVTAPASRAPTPRSPQRSCGAGSRSRTSPASRTRRSRDSSRPARPAAASAMGCMTPCARFVWSTARGRSTTSPKATHDLPSSASRWASSASSLPSRSKRTMATTSSDPRSWSRGATPRSTSARPAGTASPHTWSSRSTRGSFGGRRPRSIDSSCGPRAALAPTTTTHARDRAAH